MSLINFASPEVWGSSAWIFLHCVVNTYPLKASKNEQKHYLQFFNNLIYVLPCKLCRTHYAEWMRSEPIQYHMETRQSLKIWLFLLHNYVNLRLNKKLLVDCNEGDKKILDYVNKKQNQIFR